MSFQKDFFNTLKNRIERRKARVAVVGLGYVGLPLALEFVHKGFYVFGIDVDIDRIRHIRRRESYITDVPPAQLRKALATGRFSASDDFKVLKAAEVIIICVPTPLKTKYTPNITYIKEAVCSIANHIKGPSLIILESTTYPGTTEEVILPLLEAHRLKHGKDFYLCFSPERIDPGNKAFPVYKIPKIVGGVNPEATALGVAVYQNLSLIHI